MNIETGIKPNLFIFEKKVKNHDFKKFSITFMNLFKWLCTAVSYLTGPIDPIRGASTACLPAHLAAHQLYPHSA